MRKIIFTEDKVNEIIHRYTNGHSLNSLSRIYDVSINVIRRHLTERGIKIQNWKLTKNIRDEMIDLYLTKKLNTHIIGGKFGVSKTTVISVLKNAQIRLRNPGREKVAFDKENVVNSYFGEEKSATQIALKYGTHKSTVARYMKRNGYKLRKHTLNRDSITRKYSINEDYFKTIDTPAKAYWLGFFAADGYITKDNYILGFTLSSKDRQHLEKLKESLDSDHPVNSSERYMSIVNSPKKLYKSSTIHLSSKKVVEHIKNHGFTSNKTHELTYPKLANKLHSHFIRGFLDGDGTIQLDKEKNWDFKVAFLGGPRDFLKCVKQIIVKNCNVSKKVSFNNGRLRWGGRKQSLKILNWLYRDACKGIRLERKYKRYLYILGIKTDEYYNLDDSILPIFFRLRRIKIGMSQKGLAENIGLSQAYISAIENGYRTNTKRHYLRKIFWALFS